MISAIKKVLSLTNFLLALLLCLFFITNVIAQPATTFVDIEVMNPGMVKTGERFTLVTNIVKLPGYNPAGTLLFKWNKGFNPVVSDPGLGTMEINGQTVKIAWEKMGESGKIPIVYQVETVTFQGGAYPLLIEYYDNMGIFIQKTKVINVLAGEVVHTPDLIPAQAEAPFSLNVGYPLETAPNSTITLKFIIEKGKTVSPAALQIKLPDGFTPHTNFKLPHKFNDSTSILTIYWDYMPPHPSFDVSLDLEITNLPEAVYPFSATFLIGEKTAATFSNYIMVTSQPGKLKNEAALIEEENHSKPDKDSANMLPELDKLLDQWVKSTSGNIKNKDKSPQIKPESNLSGHSLSKSTSEDIGQKEEIRIQIFASTVPHPKLAESLNELGITEPITEDFDGSIYRYTIGSFNDPDSALDFLKYIRIKGLTDAFPVKYVNGKKID
ncbi:MAG TPA: hypothetical protein PLI65_06120 [Bacteroidales bacterium]|nr:hypothetical protein [Bacteroidales bacterium]HPR58177.1 hypothetical protein [Bacteroidales bacterium]HRW96397.1 hypothetical protein [Bacteroidales bacterium]